MPGVRWRAGDCPANCDIDCVATLEAWDAYAVVQWAADEPRIQAINPYMYKSFPPEYGLHDIAFNRSMCHEGPGCTALYDAWATIGTTLKRRAEGSNNE